MTGTIESRDTRQAREQVLARVRQIVAELEDVAPESVRLESQLEADLGMDSLSKVELQMALEETYDVMLEDAAAAAVTTIGGVVDAVVAALRERRRRAPSSAAS